MALWTPAATAGGGLIATSTVTPRASTPPHPAAGNRLHVGTREAPQENEPSRNSEVPQEIRHGPPPLRICCCHLKGYTRSTREEDQEKGRAESCQKNTEQKFHKREARRRQMCGSQASINWRLCFIPRSAMERKLSKTRKSRGSIIAGVASDFHKRRALV